MYIYIYIYILPIPVTLKKAYIQNIYIAYSNYPKESMHSEHIYIYIYMYCLFQLP